MMTAKTVSTPSASLNQFASTRLSTKPLSITRISVAPTTPPKIVPMPPVSAVPPITAAPGESRGASMLAFVVHVRATGAGAGDAAGAIVLLVTSGFEDGSSEAGHG